MRPWPARRLTCRPPLSPCAGLPLAARTSPPTPLAVRGPLLPPACRIWHMRRRNAEVQARRAAEAQEDDAYSLVCTSDEEEDDTKLEAKVRMRVPAAPVVPAALRPTEAEAAGAAATEAETALPGLPTNLVVNVDNRAADRMDTGAQRSAWEWCVFGREPPAACSAVRSSRQAADAPAPCAAVFEGYILSTGDQTPHAFGVGRLYVVLVSLHGLVRGQRMELGKDSDTGGQARRLLLSRAH